MNFTLAIFTLAGAVGVFAHEALTGEMRYHIRGTNLSMGWFLLLLSVYNFVRWYSTKMGRAQNEAIRIAREARLREIRSRPGTEYNPELDFTRDPPASPRPPHDAPPSPN